MNQSHVSILKIKKGTIRSDTGFVANMGKRPTEARKNVSSNLAKPIKNIIRSDTNDKRKG